MNRLRRAYFRALLQNVSIVVCFSAYEATRYTEVFHPRHMKFVSAPYGLHVWLPDMSKVRDTGYIVSAGRSGRDYRLLAQAFRNLPYRLQIICDSERSLKGLESLPNVSLLRSCYGPEYIQKIAGAHIVVIPLTDKDISAGQMVLLQAMALGKPVIVTRTPTTEEYGRHEETLYFVEHGSGEEIQDAILRLMGDPKLAARIGSEAQHVYQQRFSMPAYVRQLLCAIAEAAEPSVR